MGTIGMTFFESPSSVLYCKFTCFFVNSLKLIQTFIKGCMVTSSCIHLAYVKDIIFLFVLYVSIVTLCNSFVLMFLHGYLSCNGLW